MNDKKCCEYLFKCVCLYLPSDVPLCPIITTSFTVVYMASFENCYIKFTFYFSGDFPSVINDIEMDHDMCLR